MPKYGPWEGTGWVPGIAPSQAPSPPTTPGTPPPALPVHSGADMPLTATVNGRGAHIGSSTHFRRAILRV